MGCYAHLIYSCADNTNDIRQQNTRPALSLREALCPNKASKKDHLIYHNIRYSKVVPSCVLLFRPCRLPNTSPNFSLREAWRFLISYAASIWAQCSRSSKLGCVHPGNYQLESNQERHYKATLESNQKHKGPYLWAFVLLIRFKFSEKDSGCYSGNF